MDDRDAQQRIERVERLLDDLDALADPAARELALDTVGALLALYGDGLGRIVATVGEPAAVDLSRDELVGHLLLLHGLHPVDVRERVQEALDAVRPYLGSHGGGVELVDVRDGVAHVRMEGSCEGCPASAMTLKLAIEDAVLKAAPDVERVEAEGGGTSARGGPAPLLQIERSPALGSADAGANGSGPGDGTAWTVAGGLSQLAGGGTVVRRVAGQELLFLAVDGTTYAYRPRCPGCEASLETAALHGAELTCAECGHRYDVRRAGRCLDAPQLHLVPVPLLVDDAGLIRVALEAGVA